MNKVQTKPTPTTPLLEFFRLNEHQEKGLKRLGILTAGDLLFYLPHRYDDAAELKHISELKKGELAVVSGRVSGAKISKGYKSKIPMAEVTIDDGTGKVKAVWFHQPYMAKKVADGSLAKVAGVVGERKGARYFANPEMEEVAEIEMAHHGSLFGKQETARTPVYGETVGVSSLWFRHAIKRVLTPEVLEQIDDPIPAEILAKYNLPSLKTALVWIHTPRKDDDALAARKRFAFQEIFFIQLIRQKSRLEYRKNPSFKILSDITQISEFTNKFGFILTDSQAKAIKDILRDIGGSHPMTRLLEGDVGSGKTAVAATAAYATITTRPIGQNYGNLQVAYMAPTEILAKQHFESFCGYLKGGNVNVGLITSSGCSKFPSKINPDEATSISRSQLLKWVANGEIPILVGTHSLIQKSVKWKHLALAIIDEQHRFGVRQRLGLVNKHSIAPHLLSMTATPIPRTLALTIYGDLDLTLLDQMPHGRKQVITEIVMPVAKERERVYAEIRARIKEGRQVYVICPRINEPDPTNELAINAKSVTEEAKRLGRDVFPEFEMGVLHGQMTPRAKEKVMREFNEGKFQILVATSVVEVGVNVKNATMIIIEGAERFGLAQLHQLRGRVIRSNHQPYCYVFSESKTAKTFERLSALKSAASGFELAERDLEIRGAGELGGTKQWGISDLGMEAIKNIKMVEAARKEAAEILAKDPEFKSFPKLASIIKAKEGKETHFE